MGRIPERTWISRGTKLGITSPGQSTRRTSDVQNSVWKCFVFPGVEDTDTFFAPIKELMVDDFPTFGYPTSPTTSEDGFTPSEFAKSRQGFQ